MAEERDVPSQTGERREGTAERQGPREENAQRERENTAAMSGGKEMQVTKERENVEIDIQRRRGKKIKEKEGYHRKEVNTEERWCADIYPPGYMVNPGVSAHTVINDAVVYVVVNVNVLGFAFN